MPSDVAMRIFFPSLVDVSTVVFSDEPDCTVVIELALSDGCVVEVELGFGGTGFFSGLIREDCQEMQKTFKVLLGFLNTYPDL